jgi:hypothetical protein
MWQYLWCTRAGRAGLVDRAATAAGGAGAESVQSFTTLAPFYICHIFTYFAFFASRQLLWRAGGRHRRGGCHLAGCRPPPCHLGPALVRGRRRAHGQAAAGAPAEPRATGVIHRHRLPRRIQPVRRLLQPEIHSVDPESGQLSGSYRDVQINCWVDLRILGQPCGFYLVGAATSGLGRWALMGTARPTRLLPA